MWWFEQYLGKPFDKPADPPRSFNCGILGQYILKAHCGIETPLIYADSDDIRQCFDNLADPSYYDLYPFEGPIREFDIAFMMRRVRRDHLGVAVRTSDGMQILHCMKRVGVILQTPTEVMATTGARLIEWVRHRELQHA